MRRAEIIAGLILAVLSIYTAILSAKLPITWVRGRGPGAGFFPFWLSIVMLISTLIIVMKAALGKIPERWKNRRYFEPAEGKAVFWHASSLLLALAFVPVVGTYGAIMFLLVFHMKALGRGRHSWITTIAVAIIVPVCIFLFFEIMMQEILPKGMTEPLFDPLFALFNASSS